MTRFSTMWSAGSSPTSWALNLRHTFASRPSSGTIEVPQAEGLRRCVVEDPLMTLQWLQVRVKPDHWREIRPRAHRPPWDDAGAGA
jgi:hypothetical protein